MNQPKYNQETVDRLAEHFEAIINLLGEDITREGLEKTPIRAAKALLENTRGYSQDAEQIVGSAIFEDPGSQIVVVRDIEFYSLCEHHMLPFFGNISIGYMPQDRIVGLSKLGRIVDTFSRRLQVQERLTREVCDTVRDTLSPQGVIVYANAHHLCMKMRGVEKQHSTTTTMSYCGVFEDVNMRNQFFRLLEQQN